MAGRGRPPVHSDALEELLGLHATSVPDEGLRLGDVQDALRPMRLVTAEHRGPAPPLRLQAGDRRANLPIRKVSAESR